MDEQPTSEIPATLSRGTTMAVSTETFLATTRNLEVELEIVAMARSQGVTAANPIVQLTHATDILRVLTTTVEHQPRGTVSVMATDGATLDFS